MLTVRSPNFYFWARASWACNVRRARLLRARECDSPAYRGIVCNVGRAPSLRQSFCFQANAWNLNTEGVKRSLRA